MQEMRDLQYKMRLCFLDEGLFILFYFILFCFVLFCFTKREEGLRIEEKKILNNSTKIRKKDEGG